MERKKHGPVNDEALVKRWAEGWTAKQIAAEQQTDPMAISNRVSRLRKAGVKLSVRGRGRSVDVERLNSLITKKPKKSS
jgi:hypothetical protein